MFSVEYKNDNDFIFLKILKVEILKNQKENNENSGLGFKDKNLKITISKEINNENDENIIDKDKNLNNSPQRFVSINIRRKPTYKSIIKNSVNMNRSPTNINLNDQSFKRARKNP